MLILLITVIVDMAGLIYFMIASPSARLAYQLLSPLWDIPVINWLMGAVFFAGGFILLTAMILPVDFKIELERPSNRFKYILGLLLMSMGPWLDMLVQWWLYGFNLLELDRTTLMLVGIGIIPMVLATIADMTLSRKAAIVVTVSAVSLWLFYYAGLWMSGAMGNLFQALLWHFFMVFSGLASFNNWRLSMNEREPEDTKKTLEA